MKRMFPYAGIILWLAAAPGALAQHFVTSAMLPFSITEPGRYVVVEPLTYAGPTHGIHVQADHVEIDLNGYTLTGPGAGSASGIHQEAGQKGMVVKNGSITGWGSQAGTAGMVAEGANNHFEFLRMHNCGNGLLAGANARVDAVTITDIAGADVQVGLSVGSGALITDCLISGISGNVSYGLVAGRNVRIQSSVISTVVATDLAYGIAMAGGQVSHSSVVFVYGGTEGYGLAVDDATQVQYCTIARVTSDSESYGMDFQNSSASHAYRNAVTESATVLLGAGIRMGFGGTTAENAVTASRYDGLQADWESRLDNNMVAFNAAAGIRIAGERTRVDGNLIAGNLTPVAFDASTNNLVVRNAFFANTNIIALPGNHVALELITPGVDFNHPDRSYYFENIRW